MSFGPRKVKFECEWDVRNYFKYTPISVMKKPIVVLCYRVDVEFEVKTANGWVKGKPKDWIMIGPDGDLYPCDAEIFNKTYDRYDEGEGEHGVSCQCNMCIYGVA